MNAVGITTSKSSPSQAPVAPDPFGADECIALVLSPQNTVHPVIDSRTQRVRIFANAEEAAGHVLSSKGLSKFRFTVIPLKGAF